MADDLYFSMDVARYNDVLSVYMSRSKRSARVVLEQQAKNITKKAINLTPPGKEGVSGLAARALGEKSVEASLNKLFQPVNKTGKGKAQRAEIDAATAAMAATHQAARNSRGRVNRSLGKARHKVWKTDLKKYVTAVKKHVGKLAHGWASAAEKLGVPLPAWMARHSGQASGAIQITATDTEIKVILTNDVRYAADMKGIKGRLDRAVNLQRGALIREVNKFLKDDSPFRSL